MYTNDKILGGGEITAQGTFDRNGDVFYIFLMPKADSAPAVAALTARLPYNNESTVFPFQAGQWNPVVLKELSVSQSDLSSYRIFWGTEK